MPTGDSLLKDLALWEFSRILFCKDANTSTLLRLSDLAGASYILSDGKRQNCAWVLWNHLFSHKDTMTRKVDRLSGGSAEDETLFKILWSSKVLDALLLQGRYPWFFISSDTGNDVLPLSPPLLLPESPWCLWVVPSWHRGWVGWPVSQYAWPLLDRALLPKYPIRHCLA